MPGAKRWTAVQDELLEQLMEQHEEPATGKEAYWQSLAEQLPKPNRSGDSAQGRATALGLREAIARRKRGPDWSVQANPSWRPEHNAPRAVAAAEKRQKTADSDGTSPVGAPPTEPRRAQPRPAAAAAAAAILDQAELDGSDGPLIFFAGLEQEHHRRMEWARWFVMKLHAPEWCEWDGRGGTVSIIRKKFGVPKGSGVADCCGGVPQRRPTLLPPDQAIAATAGLAVPVCSGGLKLE